MNRIPKNTDELFEYSYVISIDDNRMQLLRKIFNYHNLPQPQLFEGLRKATYCVAPQIESHMAVIQMAKDRNFPYVMIFEDDVYPQKNIRDTLDQYLEKIDFNVNFLQFSWSINENSRINLFNRITARAPVTAAYLVMKSGYDEIINILKQKTWLDQVQMRFSNSYITDNPLFIQYNFKPGIFGNLGYDLHQKNDLEYFEKNYVKIEQITGNEK